MKAIVSSFVLSCAVAVEPLRSIDYTKLNTDLTSFELGTDTPQTLHGAYFKNVPDLKFIFMEKAGHAVILTSNEPGQSFSMTVRLQDDGSCYYQQINRNVFKKEVNVDKHLLGIRVCELMGKSTQVTTITASFLYDCEKTAITDPLKNTGSHKLLKLGYRPQTPGYKNGRTLYCDAAQYWGSLMPSTIDAETCPHSVQFLKDIKCNSNKRVGECYKEKAKSCTEQRLFFENVFRDLRDKNCASNIHSDTLTNFGHFQRKSGSSAIDFSQLCPEKKNFLSRAKNENGGHNNVEEEAYEITEAIVVGGGADVGNFE